MHIRKFDDKIINVLNAEIPTESFYVSQKQQQQENSPAQKCKQLKKEVTWTFKKVLDTLNDLWKIEALF